MGGGGCLVVPEAVLERFHDSLGPEPYDDFDYERALEAALEQLRVELLQASHHPLPGNGEWWLESEVAERRMHAVLNAVLGDKEKGQ